MTEPLILNTSTKDFWMCFIQKIIRFKNSQNLSVFKLLYFLNKYGIIYSNKNCTITTQPPVTPALEVIRHAEKRRKRGKGKNPSLHYKRETNPRKALALAKKDYEWEQKIPFLTDDVLSERLGRIKYVTQAMCGLDGKPYTTDETDKKLFDLFYVESKVNPRTQSFNFDENQKITDKAVGLKEILTKDVVIKVGGYHGFLKMTMAEVLSQIPDEIVNKVVAFGLNPEKDTEIVYGGYYQLASIIFYEKNDNPVEDEELPTSIGLILPVHIARANRLKDKIKPIINYRGEGSVFIDPQDIEKPFIDVGIWLRINGSNLHRTNTETNITIDCKKGKKISVYQEFNDGADSFKPTYAHTISQIPDELLTENTIGFMYGSTDYFKTKEGVIHKTEYTLIEKE
jgi:hypothetical protein